MEEYDLSLIELNETQNHDDFRVVWFSLNETPKFLTKFADSLKKFSSIEDYMNELKRIILDQCQFEYKNQPIELEKIDCFDNNILNCFINLYNRFDELAKTQKEIYPLTVYRGQILGLKELERNLGCYEKAIEIYNYIGNIWDNIDNIEHAVSCYRCALHIADMNKISRLDLKQKINDLIDQNSTNVRNINEIDNYYKSILNTNNQNELKEFQEQLNNGDNLTPNEHIDILYDIGILLMRKGDFLTIRSIDLSYQIGLCLMKKGDFPQALTSLLKAKEIIINHPQLLATLYDNISF
ncbi:hypothetical protein I4U23_002619 [Adineta vaga]|nr:hypothetical protein I4U23_002619 [Adineta vaga]